MPTKDNHPNALAEAEIKIALTRDEYERIPSVVQSLSFQSQGIENITDHYLEYAESPLGGFNFTRLRAIGRHRFLLTTKRWIQDDGDFPVRLEEESEITEGEFNYRVARSFSDLVLRKTRWNFQGAIGRLPVTVSLDALALNGRQHYFLECEALVPPKKATAARETIRKWIQKHLNIPDTTEAPSMLELLKAAMEEHG